ncbi:hypothetical protein ACOTTU_24320 [Roseobacter sp. EG26]|uniref:hypothetical protein n=1 Tax=Roseobacter sp. EG26 TaxID=3412477 RepID=UPI003CE55965
MVELHRPSCVASVRFLLLSAVVTATAQEANGLTPAECRFVHEYNEHHSGHDFPFLVGHMAHTSELCEDGKSINCEIALARREKPYFVTTDGALPIDIATIVGTNFVYTAEFLSAFTGPSLDLKPKVEKHESIVHLILIEADEPANAYSSAYPQFLERFVATEAWPCAAVNSVWQGELVEYSEVWIKADIGDIAMANCIKEEFYNASGVPGDPIGLASLFSPTRFSGAALDPPVYEGFSLRDGIVLRLVYDERMKNGQSRSETERLAGEIIETQCNY